MNTINVAFIGLEVMSYPMASHLSKNGFNTKVYLISHKALPMLKVSSALVVFSSQHSKNEVAYPLS